MSVIDTDNIGSGSGGVIGTHSKKRSPGYKSGFAYTSPFDGFTSVSNVPLTRTQAISTPFYSEGGTFNFFRVFGASGGSRISQLRIFRQSPTEDELGEEIYSSPAMAFTNSTVLFGQNIIFDEGWYEILAGLHSSSSVLTEQITGPTGDSFGFGGSLGLEHGVPRNITNFAGLVNAGKVVSGAIDTISAGSRFNSFASSQPFFCLLGAI